MPYQILGIDPTQIVEATGTPEFPLGTIGEDQDGKRYIYGRANGAIGAKVPCALDVNYDFAAGNGVVCDAVSGDTAMADNEYGWFQTSGYCADVNVEAGTGAGDMLAALADVNGDFQASAAATAVLDNVRAKALTAIASNVSDIFLYNWI